MHLTKYARPLTYSCYILILDKEEPNVYYTRSRLTLNVSADVVFKRFKDLFSLGK